MNSQKNLQQNLPPDIVSLAKEALGVNALPLWLTETQVAQLGLRTVASLQRDRCSGLGARLPFHKIGGSVRYSTNEILTRLISDAKTSTSA